MISDIDECSKNSHNCSYTTATCTNTRGSFKCICKPGFSGDGHNCTGTEHYLEHDILLYHRNKLMQLAEIVSLYIRWSYTGALSPLFPFSLGFRNHCHEYSVLIPIQTSMNLPLIPTTAAGTMPLVQTPRGRSTVLAILDLLVMDTSAKVKSYTSHFTPLSPYDVCISIGVSTLCQHRVSRISQQLMGFISDIGEGVKNTSDSSNENATCKNSEGSSKSTCKLVFSGNGHNCTVQITRSLVERTLNILLSVVEVRLMIQIILYSF